MKPDVPGEGGVPREVAEFFGKPGGRSLVIKGGAGSGKTTLALQFMEEVAAPESSFYLSTRVSDASLYIQFPWLKEKDMRSRIIDASREFLATIYKPDLDDGRVQKEKLAKIKGAQDFLRYQARPEAHAGDNEHGRHIPENRRHRQLLLHLRRQPAHHSLCHHAGPREGPAAREAQSGGVILKRFASVNLGP